MGDSLLADLIEDKRGISPVEVAIREDMDGRIDRVLATLTLREEQVIRMRFGIGEPSEHTLKEIGKMLGLSRDRNFMLTTLTRIMRPKRSHSTP